MKIASFLMILSALIFIGCTNRTADKQDHEAGSLEPLAYTIYSDKSELFVEFKPLIVGSKSNFATHLTILGESFLPLTEGKVSVSLIVGESGIRNSSDTASSPGIFRLALIPNTAGVGKLVFDIETKDYKDQIIIDSITVYPNVSTAIEQQIKTVNDIGISYLKEQAWKVEFANALVILQPFSDVIKTNGQILSAPGDEIIITANTNGIIQYSGIKTIAGSEVDQYTTLFLITGGNMTEQNIADKYKTAKANYDKAEADFIRASELVKDKIISEKEYLQAKVNFENAQIEYNAIARNFSANGQNISSPMSGFIKNIFVSEGQYVEAGTPLATISKNKKLILQANVSQKYFSKLPSIVSANFKIAGSESVFTTEELNGRIISFGKSASANSPFIPVSFEMDNIGNIIPGSIAEVYLKSYPITNALIVPESSIMEEQGNYYVFVQSGGESFEKREIEIGASDGINMQLLSGVSEGERVVTKGAYQIKLASASGELPAHGHEH